TQSQCRYRATASRSSQEPTAARPAISAICQMEFNRNVRSNWLIVLIGFLLALFDELLQAREFFRCEMFGFHQAHHETFRRTAEESIDNILDVFTDNLFATHSGFVEVRAILERAFGFAFTLENVEHGLDSGISKFTFEFLLYCLHVCGSCFPEDVHDF